MKKIIYFDPDYEGNKSPLEMNGIDINLVIMDKYENGNDNVHIYDTIEDFAEAFNHEFISDLGFVRVAEVEQRVQIFKEGRGVTSEEKATIDDSRLLLGWYDDEANNYTAYDLDTEDLEEGDALVNRLNDMSENGERNWYLGNPYEEYVYVD